MSCERLVCAACAHPVIEGRCATCRAHRERMHQRGLSPTLVIAVLLAALLLTLLLKRLLGA